MVPKQLFLDPEEHLSMCLTWNQQSSRANFKYRYNKMIIKSNLIGEKQRGIIVVPIYSQK